jgi:hypothetical protein
VDAEVAAGVLGVVVVAVVVVVVVVWGVVVFAPCSWGGGVFPEPWLTGHGARRRRWALPHVLEPRLAGQGGGGRDVEVG